MDDQIITVKNKLQLLAAFGCAMGFIGGTKITLKRKTGESSYFLRPHTDGSFDVKNFEKMLRKARAKIRRTPAECFR